MNRQLFGDVFKIYRTEYRLTISINKIKRWLRKLMSARRYNYVRIITQYGNGQLMYNKKGMCYVMSNYSTKKELVAEYPGVNTLYDYIVNYFERNKSIQIIYNCTLKKSSVRINRKSTTISYDPQYRTVTICDQEVKGRTDNVQMFYKMCEVFR